MIGPRVEGTYIHQQGKELEELQKEPRLEFIRDRKKLPDIEEQAEGNESKHQRIRQQSVQWHIQGEHTKCIYVPLRNVHLRDLLNPCSFDDQNRGLRPEAWLELPATQHD